MRYNVLAVLLPLVAALTAVPGRTAPVPVANPFRALYDLDDLPLLKAGVRTYQVSSHDPTGGNEDWGHFVRTSGNVKVLADLQGPGIVRRIWSANPSGRLRITIDGASHPVLNVPFQDLFDDKVPGFRPPIAGTSSGGSYSYVPIAFRKSCVISAVDAQPFYYQVTWQKLADADGLRSFTGKTAPEDEAAYDAAVRAWTDLGKAPADRYAVALPRRTISLPPGGKWAQPIQGPGTVTALKFSFPPGTPFSTLRQTILRITFDGYRTVRAPIGDFYGIGFDRTEWKSLPLGVIGNDAYCYFRMPFRKQARIELENQGRGTFQAAFTGTARSGVPTSPWGYFHADFHTAVNVAGLDYMFGRLRGKGHVVGVTENMRGTGNLWFLEGDEKVYVDGEATPSIYGTGTEDFYNCGWYFRDGPVNVALHGDSHKTDNEIAAWRFEIPDAIPFSKSLDFHIEHGGTDDAPGSEYASVLYWYGATGAKDVNGPIPTGAALLPKPYIPPIENAIQATEAAWAGEHGALLKKQMWQDISPYRGGGRIVLKGGPGAAASTPLEVRFADRYNIDLYLSGAGSTSMGHLLVDGTPVGQPLVDASSALPIRKVTIGPIPLTEGKHTIGISLDAGSALALTALRLTPQSPLVHDFAVVGPFKVKPDVGVKTPLPPDGRLPSLGDAFSADGKTLRWMVLRAPSGILDLAATLTPNTDVVAYASFAVNSPTAQVVPLMVGSDDGEEVWANGARVFTNRVTRGFKLDEDRVPVSLKAGWNTVVLKVDQGAGGWAVSARFPDPDGTLQYAAVVPER